MRRVLLLALVLMLPLAGLARADSFTPAQRDEIVTVLRDALKRDPSILRDALIALQQDEERSRVQATGQAIQRLRAQLVQPDDPVEGNPHGSVTMVEFFDTRCPYCRRMLPELAQLLRQEPDLRLVLKDMPILGPASQLESRALLAAQRQGGYGKLRDALMGSGEPATVASIRATAERLGLDGAKLQADMDDPAIRARLAANVALAQQLGVQGTPAIIVGTQMIAGATDVADMRAAIAQAKKEN